mmetsp:Transcript_18788/g.54297  ORF Transcript_18788/g.54297 Transcript_18788/m.54297 type:complete len:1068 (-) Transcript_18788:77-3280(-)
MGEGGSADAADEGSAMARRPSVVQRAVSGASRSVALLCAPLLRIPTAADHLLISSSKTSSPLLLGALVAPLIHARLSALGLLGGTLGLLALYMPFWLLSLLVTEIGVYALVVLSVFKIGRSIVRLIAFPGSTQRVYGEIETEFAKYSVRMLDASCSSFMELGNTVVGCGDPSNAERSDVEGERDDNDSEEEDRAGGAAIRTLPPKLATYMQTRYGASPNDVGPLWRRAVSYRDRVAGMYADVLRSVLEGPAAAVATAPPSAAGAASRLASGLTRYGNNPLASSQSVGDLSGVSPSAVDDGRTLASLLDRALGDLDEVERAASGLIYLAPGRRAVGVKASRDAVRAAKKLVLSAGQLRDFLPSLKPPTPAPSGGDDDGNGGGDQSGSDNGNGLPQNINDAAKTAASSVLPVLDPPPHSSVFGLDVLRGATLSRYRGARQFWVDRPKRAGGGRLDVFHIPAIDDAKAGDQPGENVPGSPTGPDAAPSRGRRPVKKAVVYCNPNAGLTEVAAGMSLVGGNVHPEDPNGSSVEENCWTDFYIHAGYDVFLFNYAGFGRSHGGRPRAPTYKPGCIPCLGRMVHSSLFDFAPSPSSLKSDALSVARHVVDELGAERLLIHGESIGGMAAASAAKELSLRGAGGTGRGQYPSMLLCDRSFSNLLSTAERLVGSWTGPAISALVPTWNTDVANDFLSASCPKVAACDAADAIIADGASLKSGISLGTELHHGKTAGAGRIVSTPVEYRMSDHDDVGVTEGRIKSNGGVPVQVPAWPRDRRLGITEAFHFAACARRVGKVATTVKRRAAARGGRGGSSTGGGGSHDDEEGIEITELGLESGSHTPSSSAADTSPAAAEAHVTAAWKALACADGLTGSPLGAAVRDGHDCAVTWLCCALTFGGQVVAERAVRRLAGSGSPSSGLPQIAPSDFNSRPEGYSAAEGNDEGAVHPVPLPEVMVALREASDGLCGTASASAVPSLAHELRFCAGVLEYVVTRLSSERVAAESHRALNFHATIGGGEGEHTSVAAAGSERIVGRFFDLRCGHNNQYSAEEREHLREILGKVVDGNECSHQIV